MNALTAAHRSWPHNTLARVTNTENSKSVVVRVNDRGPYVDDRGMDLSLAAFTTIADRSRGVISATIERLGDQELLEGSVESEPTTKTEPEPEPISETVADCTSRFGSYYQRRITRDVHFIRGVPHEFSLGNTA